MAKSKEIEDTIIASLRSMKPHQRYLSRQAMCQKFHISRTTADNVVANMIRQGWMYTRKGSGTFVSPHLSDVVKVEEPAAARSVGIIIPDVRYNQYPNIFQGIEEYFRSKNVDFLVCNTDDDPNREYAFVQRLIAAGVDGAIIVPSAALRVENFEPLIRNAIPFVFWNRSVDAMPSVPQICLNGYHGGLIATNHLIEKGYSRIVYLAPKRFRSSMDRFFGYDSALANAGIVSDPALVRMFLEDDTPEAIYELASELLHGQKPPDAFVCFVDTLAVPVIKAIEEAGLMVSDDVGVIGFESSINWTDAHMTLKLSYVDINSTISGRLAAQTLYRMIEKVDGGIRPSMPVVRPTLVVRDTCKGKKKRG